MSQRPSLIRRSISFLFSEAAVQAFWTYAFPPLFGLAAAAAGIVERQPLMWVLAAGSLSFAMMSLGLLAFGRWRFWQTPEHKVSFQRVLVSRNQIGRNKQILLGFVMKSVAPFPLEITLKKMTTTVLSRLPTNKIVVPKTIRVDAGSDFYFTGDLIDLAGVTDELMVGELEFEIEYGRPGGRKFNGSYSQILSIPLDQKKPFTSSQRLLENQQLQA